MANQEETKLRLDALVRVSRRGGREDRDLRSPDQQREIIKREAARLNAELYWHPDSIDVSGKTMDREDIALALGRLRRGETDGLIVAFASRLSRARVDEAIVFKDAIDEAGGRLVIGDMAGIDLDTASGELMFTTMLGIARFQWRQSKESWERSRKGAIKAGKAIGRAPFGYRHTDPTRRATGRGVKNSRLVTDEEAAPLVRGLFERKATGATWLELAKWMDEASPLPDGRLWARSSVRSIVENPAYLGVVRHGEHELRGAHEPLVTASLWRRAQNPPGRRTPRGDYMLTGLVLCDACGRRMHATKTGQNGYRVFHCDNRACPTPSTIMNDRLDREVVTRLAQRIDEDAVLRSTDDLPDVEAARLEVDRLTSEVETLAMVVPRSSVAVAAHQAALDALERELEAAQDALSEAVGARAPAGTLPAAEHEWDELDVSERREVIRAAVKEIRVRRSKGKGPASDIAYRVEVDFHDGLTRAVGDAYARVLGMRTGQTWIAHSMPVDDATRSLLRSAA